MWESTGDQGPPGGGIARPTAGRIDVDGSNLVDLSDPELVRYRLERVGIIFQFFNLVPTLTAEENIGSAWRSGPSTGRTN